MNKTKQNRVLQQTDQNQEVVTWDLRVEITFTLMLLWL